MATPLNQPEVKKPKISASNLGVTWSNLRRQSQSPKVQLQLGLEPADGSGKEENATFTDEDLMLQWLSMCNRMPQKYSGVAARMKNMNPHITEFPAVELVVPNEIIKTEVENIRGSIVATLKLHLHNSAITLSMRVAEREEQERVLTRREQFDALRTENPAVDKLRELFNLELA